MNTKKPRRVAVKKMSDPTGAAWHVVRDYVNSDPPITLTQACNDVGFSVAQFHSVLRNNAELREAWESARPMRAEQMVERALAELDDDADDTLYDADGRPYTNAAKIRRAELRVRTLLHLAARSDPERYGDRVINDQRIDGQPAGLFIGDSKSAAEIYRKRRAEIEGRKVGDDK